MSKRTSKKTTKTAQTPYSKKITRFNAIIEKTENLSEDKRAMDELRLMSISTGGCVNDNMRKKVWPLLIHAAEHDHLKLKRDITNHDQYEQVEKDVDRSMYKFTRHFSDLDRSYKRQQLSKLVNSCLLHDSELHYYQGFHDIATVFLLECGEKIALPCLYRLSHYHLHDAMYKKSLEEILNVLPLIYEVIKRHDPPVAKVLKESGMDVGHYALSWVLTWFSHVIDDIELVSRLFDVFLASHPLFVIYVCASVVLERRHELLNTECEFTAIFSLLNNFPETHTVITEEWIERVIQRSTELYRLHPLYKLSHKIPASSPFVNYPFDYMQVEKSKLDYGSVFLWSALAVSVTVASYLLYKPGHH